jgi:hypothetical protein
MFDAMQPSIRQATRQDIETVADILREAARWLEQSGIGMWRDGELAASRITGDVDAGLFFIAEDFVITVTGRWDRILFRVMNIG